MQTLVFFGQEFHDSLEIFHEPSVEKRCLRKRHRGQILAGQHPKKVTRFLINENDDGSEKKWRIEHNATIVVFIVRSVTHFILRYFFFIFSSEHLFQFFTTLDVMSHALTNFFVQIFLSILPVQKGLIGRWQRALLVIPQHSHGKHSRRIFTCNY
jgi:hypothetical protein